GVQPASSGWSSGMRRAALACAMIWAKDQKELVEHTSPNFLAAGHSRGGAAAWLLTKSLYCKDDPTHAMCCFDPDQSCTTRDDLPDVMELDEYDQCGLVAIAQRFSSGGTVDPTDTHIPMTAVDVPPMLSIVGSVDEDTRGQALAAFDQRVPEHLVTGSKDYASFATFDETLVWTYGPIHSAWGGTLTAPQSLPPGKAIADAIGAHYLERFSAGRSTTKRVPERRS